MKSEKDKTLNEIISYCKKKMTDIGNNVEIIADDYDSDAVYNQLQGQVDAYEDIALKCINMTGYSGVMPLEVENQSEDAKFGGTK
ncbi:hypothetical protein [uncultured Bifidobacterium sp.]|uniref:hypothetical protein n=1 Tax=uncultured Bifidobacterium sp. TaxID=165187 RepID=UPI00258FD9B7|nr:hypothetical protein [uncultured Bifidobacterium sp.]